jgi:hypothetical protein
VALDVQDHKTRDRGEMCWHAQDCAFERAGRSAAGVRLVCEGLTRPRPFLLPAPKRRGPTGQIERAQLAVDTCRMAKKPVPEPPNLFWLTYCHSDGSAAGVVVIESRSGLLHARLKASLAGADRGLEFASGHQIDPESAGQIPANTIGRFLDDCDLRKLQRVLIKKRPPAPSVRRRTAAKRRMGEHGRNHSYCAFR